MPSNVTASQNPLTGTWISMVGSTLILQVGSESDPAAITGTLTSTQYDPNFPAQVYGSVYPTENPQGFVPVAFTAYWPPVPQKNWGPSVTSYTGQYSNTGSVKKIEVIFLEENQANAQNTALWESTGIGYDIFTPS